MPYNAKALAFEIGISRLSLDILACFVYIDVELSVRNEVTYL